MSNLQSTERESNLRHGKLEQLSTSTKPITLHFATYAKRQTASRTQKLHKPSAVLFPLLTCSSDRMRRRCSRPAGEQQTYRQHSMSACATERKPALMPMQAPHQLQQLAECSSITFCIGQRQQELQVRPNHSTSSTASCYLRTPPAPPPQPLCLTGSWPLNALMLTPSSAPIIIPIMPPPPPLLLGPWPDAMSVLCIIISNWPA